MMGVGRHSTKFNTPADYVRAYEKAIEDPVYKALRNSTVDGRDKVTLKMTDVFGPNFQARIKGFTRLWENRPPTHNRKDGISR